MKNIITLFILLQICVIVFLVASIYKKRVKGASVVSIPIPKENIQYTPHQNLDYYYEPKENSKYQITNDLVKNDATYLINSDSLNERFDYRHEKSDRVYRIITLGDSYTFGLYVNTADNWTEQLEDLLNTKASCPQYDSYEVINLGVHGYDIQYSLERFKLRGIKYDPNLIIWLTKYDDYTQINETLRGKLEMYEKEMRESGEYDKKLEEKVAHPAWRKAIEETYELLGQEKITTMITQDFNEFAQLYAGPLLMLNFEYESNEVKDFYRKMSNRQPQGIYYDALTNIYKDPKNYFIDDGHPTVEGHQVIASDVYNFLISHDLYCN